MTKTVEESKRDRIRALLSGKVDPENEFVSYALDKSREAIAEQKAIEERMNELKRNLRGLEIRTIELGAEIEKYGQDITHFDPELSRLDRIEDEDKVQKTEEDKKGDKK